MKQNLVFYVIIACLFLCTNVAKGQTLPGLPGESADSYSIEFGQNLMFGVITLSEAAGSGTVTISNTGNRSNTGSVMLLSGDYHEASFYLTLPINRTFQINTPTTIELNGSNGGVLNLTLGDLSLTKNSSGTYDSNVDGSRMEIKVGGTLSINSITSNPGGNYSATIPITFTVQ